MDAINLTTKLVGEIKGDFYIPSYQRGYRWDEEVTMLLNDIKEVKEGANYSLQPIVIKRMANEKYELIDGQQRLTTIYLIIRYISQLNLPFQQNFSIEYETRKESKAFLENISADNIDNEPNNIDELFMQKAYRHIIDWFEKEDDKVLSAFNLYKKLKEKIHVIWYEVATKEDSVALFTRLNIGRIPLRNSELVKALFLSRNNGIDRNKQVEIATQWDLMEKELHNDSFWYFITNEKPELYPTRIELIFNLMADKDKKEREKFYTFFYFDKEIKETEYKADVWKRIQRYFQRLKEWYENHDLYHKIGYLVATDSNSMQELIEKSKNKRKTTFQESLDELIATSIKLRNKEYSDLTYENRNDYLAISKLLLLFNVETIRGKSDKTVRFPFNKYKKEEWTLEHIHAQQSEGLNKKEQWIEWLKLHKQSLENFDFQSKAILLSNIDKAINDERLNLQTFKELFDQVINILSEEGSIEYTNSLSNLALLGHSSNAALNNSTFDVKRNRILEMDKKADFIPECTRRVFLKYYTPSHQNQLHFWGDADRKAYINAMNDTLNKYLGLISKTIQL